MNTNKNYYQVLGIDPTVSVDEIKKAYKRLARTYHPDLNPKRPVTSEDRFKRVQEAYGVLSDPVSRQRYDQSLGISQPIPSSNYQPHQVGQTEIKSGPRSIYIYQEESKRRWLDSINWRRKLAVVIWAFCLLGSFLPTSSSVIVFTGIYPISTAQRLVQISIPLVMIWAGSWLSDHDGVDTSVGPALRVGFGIVLEFLGWGFFSRYVGFYLLGPLILRLS